MYLKKRIMIKMIEYSILMNYKDITIYYKVTFFIFNYISINLVKLYSNQYIAFISCQPCTKNY